jgi:hypothetical protein
MCSDDIDLAPGVDGAAAAGRDRRSGASSDAAEGVTS